MDALKIIDKYYNDNPELKDLLLIHSRLVTEKALFLAQKHPELDIDTAFVAEAGMIHDIGIFPYRRAKRYIALAKNRICATGCSEQS